MTKAEKEIIEKELNHRIKTLNNEKRESDVRAESPETRTELVKEKAEAEEAEVKAETEEAEVKAGSEEEPAENRANAEAGKQERSEAFEKLRAVLFRFWAIFLREARGFGRESAGAMSDLWTVWRAEFRYIREASRTVCASMLERMPRKMPDQRIDNREKPEDIERDRFRTAASDMAERLRSDLSDRTVRSMFIHAAAASLGVLIVLMIAGRTPPISYEEAFIASTARDAAFYTISDETAVESGRLVRGTAVNKYNQTREIDGITYVRVEEASGEETGEDTSAESSEEEYIYINEENLSETPDDVVREKEVYVRTPATIYAEAEGPAIASFAPKGSRYDITGYDRMNADGSVHKYKVAYTGDEGETAEGYIYGKYLTDTQEKADAVYNDNGVYDKAKADKYSFNLYGGKASHLDYYPFEKPEIEGNEFCSYARAMYLNCAAVVNYKPYVKLINDTDCNAVVLDIKDGVLAYKSEVSKELSPRSYKTAYVSVEEYKKGVDAYRETGAYLIGRIVVFNDPVYAKDHPEDCIKYDGSTDWPSGYSRDVWEFNVRLAQEAVREFGFNEIQFDYVRFPESSYEMSKSGKANFRNKYDEEKGQAIQNFCMYAADQIHETGAYFSIDVFGESAYGYMTAYGQYWPGLSNVVDAISAMPYTDHMGVDGGWENPYRIMKSWGKKARKQQDKIEHPAAARTWITGYDTPHWDPVVDYGTSELRAQVNGLEKAGLDGGFIPWNAASSYSKYKQYKKIWKEK